MKIPALLVCTFVSLLGGCSSEAKPSAESGASGSARPRLAGREAIEAAAVVIDVRTKEEFEGGHLPKAINLPVDDIEANVAKVRDAVGGDVSKPVAVYCAAGKRAERAKGILEKAGFSNVTNAGGYAALRD